MRQDTNETICFLLLPRKEEKMEATRKQEERFSKRRKTEAWGARGNGEQTDLLFDDLLHALRFFDALLDELSQLGERAQHFV